jgi:uncharacterized iron-regulated membrane protein
MVLLTAGRNLFLLWQSIFNQKEDSMRKVQFGLATAAVLLMALTGCTAKLAKEDREILNQALTASQAATQSAQAAEAAAGRADGAAKRAEAAVTAASRAEAAAQKAEAAAQSAEASAAQAQTAAGQAEQSALKAQKAFETGMKK